ncbi:MAG: hypothetical protein M3232_03045 [Thermoproteota archaeon]|nr:hypothetical protein [Thermoproteota archaeon]
MVFETNTIGYATPIPSLFNFNLQITATQEQESEELRQTVKNRQTVSHNNTATPDEMHRQITRS